MPVKAIATTAVSAVVALLTAVPAASQAPAPTTPRTPGPAAPKVDIQPGRTNTNVEFDLSDASRTATPATGVPVGAGRGAPSPSVAYVVLDTLPDGSRCLRVRRGSQSDALVAGIRMDTEAFIANLLFATYPRCPRADAGVR